MPLDTAIPRMDSARRRVHRAAWAGTALLVTLLAGCDSIFEVDNPNNIQGEDVEQPAAQAALVNGAFGTVARGLAASLGIYSPVTDEITFIGSRDAWRQLNIGVVDDPQNEFLNVAFPFVAQGRWTADEAIENLERFRSEGTLRSEDDLARAYLYGAIAYINIADTWDNFALSSRRDAAPPVGESDMQSLYATAIDHLTSGLEIVRRTGNRELELNLLAMRSRAYYARQLWGILNPSGSIPADPLVASAEAAEDARAFFSLSQDPFWRYAITLGTNDMVPGGEITLGHNMNDRAELQFGPDYVSTDPEDVADVTGIALLDPIDDIPDPFVTAEVAAFQDAFIYTTETIVSARELHLILAEYALAQSDMGNFLLQINAVRTIDGLTPFDPAVHAITPLELLQYERRRNLFLQNKRLADMYRFGVESRFWAPTSVATNTPGTFFPIPMVEQQSNCHLAGTC